MEEMDKLACKVLFNNYDSYELFDDAKKEIAECNDISIDDVSNEQVWEYISNEEREEWDYAMSILNSIDGRWIVGGNIGTWRGKYYCMHIFDTAKEMVDAITKDCDYIKIEFNLLGELYITASHHDGRNCMQCRVLSDKGYKVYDNWNYDYHSTIANKNECDVLQGLWNCNVFSHNPHIEIPLGWKKAS